MAVTLLELAGNSTTPLVINAIPFPTRWRDRLKLLYVIVFDLLIFNGSRGA